jgi:hypothetical protein
MKRMLQPHPGDARWALRHDARPAAACAAPHLPRRSQEDAKRARHGGPAAAPDVAAPGAAPAQQPAAAAAAPAAAPAAPPPPAMTRDQVVRRLRKLRQPATLFGETDALRSQRLHLAERNVAVEDEAAGGQQGNLHIQMAREQRGSAAAAAAAAAGQGAAAGRKAAAAAAPPHADGGASADEEEGGGEAAALAAAFQAAADVVAERNLPLEERLARWLRGWMADWEADLASRPAEVKASPAGRQADVRFGETQAYLRPLFARLAQRSLDPQMLAGVKLIAEAMRERNYLHAYKVREARRPAARAAPPVGRAGGGRAALGRHTPPRPRPGHCILCILSKKLPFVPRYLMVAPHSHVLVAAAPAADLHGRGHRQLALAHRRHPGGPPRARLAREDLLQVRLRLGAHHERRGHPQVHPGAQAADDLLPAPLPHRPLALRGL